MDQELSQRGECESLVQQRLPVQHDSDLDRSCILDQCVDQKVLSVSAGEILHGVTSSVKDWLCVRLKQQSAGSYFECFARLHFRRHQVLIKGQIVQLFSVICID